MDMLPFVDASVKEYMLFRGFMAAFDVFSKEAQEVRNQARTGNCVAKSYPKTAARRSLSSFRASPQVAVMQASWVTLTPHALVCLIFDTLIPQQELEKLWQLMELLTDQMYSRLNGDHDDSARQIERTIFQVRMQVPLQLCCLCTARALR